MENFINWLKKEKEVNTEEINTSVSVDDIINNVKAVYADKLDMQSEQQVNAAKIAAPQTKPMASPTVAGGKGQVPVPQQGLKPGAKPPVQGRPTVQQPVPGQQAKPLVSDGGTVPVKIGNQTVQLPSDPAQREKMLRAMLQRGQGKVK